MKTEHTKDQRKRLFLLARLLDRVPKKHFDMDNWFKRSRGTISYDEDARALKSRECGFAGCAIGWGMTSGAISAGIRTPNALVGSLLGEGYVAPNDITKPATALFGIHRKGVTPKRVASDIRRYLKDGTLPPK